MRILPAVIIFVLLVSCGTQNDTVEPGRDTALITVIGTNDVHGELLSANRRGGLTTLSGYVAAVRAARAEDGGAVLLIDAGDMWQGTLESNLVEGASVVEAYNAIGYSAAAIGNHEFDFGPIGKLAIPAGPADDPHGALRQRITEAQFPVLSANIVDTTTGQLIDWENVSPSIVVDAAGVKVGIIGLITAHALQVTASANVKELEIAPLADAIIREATALRSEGVEIVIVTAHAGGECTEFDDPNDLSSCEPGYEIMRVANALPVGLIDHIIAGHAHNGMAHIVNDIAVTSAFSNTYAFDRVDYTVNRSSGEVVNRKVFPPQLNCPAYNKHTNECEWETRDPDVVRLPDYEGQPVRATAELEAIAARTRALTAAIKSEPLGVSLETPFLLDGTPESPLGNLFTDAILEGVDADISIHNVTGGIRAILPPGEVTFGKVYEVAPFDNYVVILDVSGADLRRIIEGQARKSSRRAGFSGMRVFVGCEQEAINIKMVLNNGHEIADVDRVRISTNDFLATLGDGILSPGMPDGGYQFADDPRLNRDLIVDWFKNRGGSIHADEFDSTDEPRWNFSESFPGNCQQTG
ncbi:MAG: bifunctional metallophosphatase/5'-nucleotidase [Woeseiaceae bacterium]